MNTQDLLNYLFAPEKKNSLVNVINDEFQNEIESLDEYLNKIIPEAWASTKKNHSLTKKFKSWTSTWKDTLLPRLILSEINIEKRSSKNNFLNYLPIQSKEYVFKKYEYQIIQNTSFLDIELKKTYHPDIKDREVTIKTQESYFENPVENALYFIESLKDNFYDLITNSVSSFALLEVKPNLQIGQCVSLSINSSPGIILSTVPSKILFSETILHEACHSRLNSAQKVADLFLKKDKLLSTPLRSDLRPISGLFHQCYVLFWLSNLYNVMLKKNEISGIKKNIEKIEKRFVQHKKDLRESCEALLINKDYLSENGIKILGYINSKI